MSDPMEFYPSASLSTSRRSTRSSSKRSYFSSHRRSVSPDRPREHRRRRSPSPAPGPPLPPGYMPPSSSSDMRAYDPYYDVPRKRARTKDHPPPPSPEPKPTHMLDIYHPSVLGSKVMVRTLPDIKDTPLNLRVSPHPEIPQAIFDTLAENKRARLVQYYMSNVRDPDVDHVIWTSVSVRALNPKDRVEAFYFGAYACCWEKPVDRRGLAAAFQGVAKTNIFAEYSAALAALQACPPGDSVLIKTSSGPIAHGLLKGTFPSDSNGPQPPHVNIRDAFMNLVEKRRGRVYIRVVPSKSMIPVGAKVVRMAEKARRDYEASVLPESELPINALAKRQSPPAPTPSHMQDTIDRGAHHHHHHHHASTTTTTTTTTATTSMDRSRVLSPPQQLLISPTIPQQGQHYRWNDSGVDNYRPSSPRTRSPVENHRSRLDPSTSPVRARDPRIRRMEENMQMQQQQQRMEYHHPSHHQAPLTKTNRSSSSGGGGGDSSPREQQQRQRQRPLYNDAFSMSDNVDTSSSSNNPSQMARKLDAPLGAANPADSDDDDEIFYDAKDYLDDYDGGDEDLEDGKDVSPPRRMAQVAIAAKGSISAWVNTMFDKYHIQ
ncbi:predicted protein [Lichtheimia corymbifera JMRC:FSU:9682]|uniref:Uncharacterized protein n=1 Tax=Lichtheimia corymbifera JMRC:FSU:9682 TaxID=1263082 RepID=A0A068RU14_9FUNG|nr:predicted protein [Lichtheimia corymbifera JMRC:FSU:9682]